MHLVRIISSFDGERRWDFDLNGDGTNELAGDFDADGVVDIGVGGEITMTGGSLGGIMSMLVGALEPKVKAIAPVVGGGVGGGVHPPRDADHHYGDSYYRTASKYYVN